MHFNMLDKFEKAGFTFNKDKSLCAQPCVSSCKVSPSINKVDARHCPS